MGIRSFDLEARSAVHVWVWKGGNFERICQWYEARILTRAEVRLFPDLNLGVHHLRGDTKSVSGLIQKYCRSKANHTV
jgi:hypothetical protein